MYFFDTAKSVFSFWNSANVQERQIVHQPFNQVRMIAQLHFNNKIQFFVRHKTRVQKPFACGLGLADNFSR